MAESKILSNIDYTIHNYSNYDISLKETKDIVDVPYFPAQNIVDTEGVSLFNINVDYWFLLKDENNNNRVFGLVNKPDMRFTFVELSDDARYFQYRFGGNNFPQGREKYSVCCDGRKIYIGFGECDERYVNDLWEYDIFTNEWKNLNFSIQEKPINEVPSRRGKTNLVVLPSEIWIFGGETDILKIHSEWERNKNLIPLNDLWYYNRDTNEWFNLDPYRKLPHRQGNIIYIDSNVVKILIEGGVNEIGINEPTAIWTYDRNTHDVTYDAISSPFEPHYYNQAFFIDGQICYLVNGTLYRWDNSQNQFDVLKTTITSIHQSSKDYLVVTSTQLNRGDDSLIGSMKITIGKIYNYTNDTLLETKSIIPPVHKEEIPTINIGNYQTWYMYGVGDTDTNTFNENMFYLNHATLQTQKITIPSEQRPQERIYPAISYDRVHSRIWLFGGTDGSRFYNDLWYFDLNTHTWYKVFDGDGIDNNDDFPAPRQKAGLCVVVNGRYVYIIGGYSDTHAFNDFWQYDTIRNTWEKMYIADNIPFGSQYYIFEWRDRLFLFNGEVDGLYRFYYSNKQFVKQPFVFRGKNVSKILLNIIQQKQYLAPPIQFTVINDYLFIQNSQVLLRINLENRVVDDLVNDFDISLKNKIIWLDFFKGFIPATGKIIYINYSELQVLTKNQVPLSLYSKNILEPTNCGFFLYDEINTNQLIYYDDSGIYKLNNRYIKLNKAELLIDKLIGIAGTTVDYPDVDWNDENSVWNKTIEKVASPKVYPFSPWFLYNKSKLPIDYYKGAYKVINDSRRKRIFIVYDSGNILKINTHDYTTFSYYPKFWSGSVVGYNELTGKFFCYGGIRDDDRRTPYMQSGFECTQIITGDSCQIGSGCKRKEMTHCGVIELDIDFNELSLKSIVDYTRNNNVTLIDYNITREYLIGILEKYLDNYTANRSNLSLNQIKNKIYNATQSLVDDLSTLEVVYESGNRPKGRAYSQYIQLNNKLYIFGGCECFNKDGESCEPNSDATDIFCKYGVIANKPYYTTKIGTMEGLSESEKDNESKKAYIFDMNNNRWTEIAQMPEWRYMGSAIVDKEGRYIYIIGGYTDIMCTHPAQNILVYDIYSNIYKIINVPKKFRGRANPILYWIDDDRLLIMYGFVSKVINSEWFHLPISDAWIYDRKNKIMYKAFQDLFSTGGIHIKDHYVKTEEDKLASEREEYVLIPVPIQNESDIKIILAKYDLITGDVDILPINPSSEILNEFSFKIVDDGFGGEFQAINT